MKDVRKRLAIEATLRILENLPTGDDSYKADAIAKECSHIIRLLTGLDIKVGEEVDVSTGL